MKIKEKKKNKKKHRSPVYGFLVVVIFFISSITFTSLYG